MVAQGVCNALAAVRFRYGPPIVYLCVMSARSDGPLWKWEAAGSNPATQTKSVVLVAQW